MMNEDSVFMVVLLFLTFTILLGCFAFTPILSLAVFLGKAPGTTSQNALLGLFAFVPGAVAFATQYDAIARTPPIVIYVVVGGWVSGSLAIVALASIRYGMQPDRNRLSRGWGAWFALGAVVALALTFVIWAWSVEW